MLSIIPVSYELKQGWDFRPTPHPTTEAIGGTIKAGAGRRNVTSAGKQTLGRMCDACRAGQNTLFSDSWAKRMLAMKAGGFPVFLKYLEERTRCSSDIGYISKSRVVNPAGQN